MSTPQQSYHAPSDTTNSSLVTGVPPSAMVPYPIRVGQASAIRWGRAVPAPEQNSPWSGTNGKYVRIVMVRSSGLAAAHV
jgi:hypothetical protein